MLPGSTDLDRSQSADKNAFYPLRFPLYCEDCDKSSNSVLKLLSQESLYRVRGRGRKSSSYCLCVLPGYCTQYPALTCALFFFLFFSFRFSILYIHCFVYTVYDDFGGQWTYPGHSGQNANFNHTANTTTETSSTGMWYYIIFSELKVSM